MPPPILRRLLAGPALLAVLFAGCSRDKPAAAAAPQSSLFVQPVEVAPVSRRDLTEAINIVGSIAANETAQIRAEIAGQVRKILFNEGQKVVRGQILVKIDDS